MSRAAASTKTSTTTEETHQCLPEVGGAGNVEEKSRREVSVVEKLDELLPDERGRQRR